MTSVLAPPIDATELDDEGGARPSPASRVAIAAVRLYQAARLGRPSPCRYVPSCSAYAADALAKHGLFKGAWLALRRLGRCRPWGGHGYDPVPDPLEPDLPLRRDPR